MTLTVAKFVVIGAVVPTTVSAALCFDLSDVAASPSGTQTQCPADGARTECAGDCVFSSGVSSGDTGSGVTWTDIAFVNVQCATPAGATHAIVGYNAYAAGNNVGSNGVTAMSYSAVDVCAHGINADCTGCASAPASGGNATNSDAGRGGVIMTAFAGVVAAFVFA